MVRARGLAKRIGNAPLAIVDKRRERAGESEVMNVIGEVEGRHCILVDDIVDSGGTLVNAASALLNEGATEVNAYVTHGVLSGGAIARISGSKLQELVITDSIEMRTVTVGLSTFQGQYSVQWNLLMAASVIAMLPVIAVYIIGQRWFIQGITMTGLGGR